MRLLLLIGYFSTFRMIFGLRGPSRTYIGSIARRISNEDQIRRHATLIDNTDSPKEEIKPWFSKGLAFSCSMCGNCCSGSSGSVRFSELEAFEMATLNKVSVEEFYTKFTRRRGRGSKAYFELKEKRRDNGDMDCIFLDREKIPGKAICSLYGSRPAQCRTWPFWPELLEDEKSWKDARLGPEGCPGINKGEVVPYEEIIRQRDLPITWNVPITK